MIRRRPRRTGRPQTVLALLAAVVGVVLAGSVFRPVGAQNGRRVLVLGIDGMDPRMLRQFIDEGYLPLSSTSPQPATLRP